MNHLKSLLLVQLFLAVVFSCSCVENAGTIKYSLLNSNVLRGKLVCTTAYRCELTVTNVYSGDITEKTLSIIVGDGKKIITSCDYKLESSDDLVMTVIKSEGKYKMNPCAVSIPWSYLTLWDQYILNNNVDLNTAKDPCEACDKKYCSYKPGNPPTSVCQDKEPKQNDSE